MEMHHRVSANGHGRYHGSVKTKDLHSQKQHEHGDMRAGKEKEGGERGFPVHYGFDKDFKSVGGNGGPHQTYGKSDRSEHGRDGIDKHGHSKHSDKYDFSNHKSYRHDSGRFPHDGQGVHFLHGSKVLQGPVRLYQVTQITVTHSEIFSGSHLESPKKIHEAQQNFLNAIQSYIKNPNDKSYKSLNDAMTKLLHPAFAPATTGGAAQVDVRNVNGVTMVKVGMEVTPAPTKSLDEAREDLKNAYSTRRDGEDGIAEIRKAASDNYRRALSEKFKSDGVISHTNNAPSTPVFKTSVIYVVKVTQINLANMHELKLPKFEHNLHGRFKLKDHRSFWNDHRPNHRSYADMLRADSKKQHHGKDNKSADSVGIKHGHNRSNDWKAEKAGHNHLNSSKTDRAEHNHRNSAKTEKIEHNHRNSSKADRAEHNHKRGSAKTDKAS